MPAIRAFCGAIKKQKNKQMKRSSLYINLLIGTALLLSSCTKNFDSINTNPDASVNASAPGLANTMIVNITASDISGTKSFCQPFLLGKYLIWTEDQESYQYNKITRNSFSRITLLRNIPKMIAYADQDTSNIHFAYEGLGHFIRAWQFYQLTMQVGDIPYSEAVEGEQGNIKPKYDSQKDVFIGILKELDSANLLFAKAGKFAGDIIYKGDPDQWRRLANSFELNVLLQLYKKTSDADLNVIARFKDIAQNRPLMRDYNDNFAVTYQNAAGLCYPWSNTPTQINSFVIYPMLTSTLINPLKALQDRRLFYYAEPAQSKIKAGANASSWDAYVGNEPSDPIGTLKTAHNNGAFCDFNKRYVNLFNAEPVGQFNYWDAQFALAEGAVRGWLPAADAETYYEAGIKGSMNFIVNYTDASYAHGMPIDDAYITAYLAGVKLTGSTENMLDQIITQKYLANFMQDVDYMAWYDNRRTGYPKFVLNTSTNLNTPNTNFPLRWMYPQSELDYNGDNVAAAIQSQYGGSDDVNKVMWILQ